jgi:hypothetical protein
MTPSPKDPRAELPIWKGRRGWITAAACCVLALPCAFGVFFFAERSVIVPACAAYASAHGMTYTDFKLAGVKQPETEVVCLLTQANGKEEEVSLNNLVPFVTNVLVEFAMSLEITVPAFAVLLGLARAGWYTLSSR